MATAKMLADECNLNPELAGNYGAKFGEHLNAEEAFIWRDIWGQGLKKHQHHITLHTVNITLPVVL